MYPGDAVAVYLIGEVAQNTAFLGCSAVWCAQKGIAVGAPNPATIAGAIAKCAAKETFNGIKMQIIMDLVGGMMQNEYHLLQMHTLDELPEVEPAEGESFTPNLSCGIDVKKAIHISQGSHARIKDIMARDGFEPSLQCIQGIALDR